MIYSITKSEADLLTKFEYSKGKFFSPYVGEQTNGDYIVDENMYGLLKDTEQFKKVNFAGKKLVEVDSLEFKTIQE